MALRVVFIDKDGTLIEDVPYNIDPTRVKFTPNALEGLQRLQDAGFALVLVSNQSGVARGYFAEADVEQMDGYLRDLLYDLGTPLLASYYCFHHPRGALSAYAIGCACRKPAPGLLLRAAAEHEIDLNASFMVGDILDDVEAGHAAGCRSVLLHPGGETEWLLTASRTPDLVAKDLDDAATLIIEAAVAQRALERGLRVR